ncbi:hypothetical protein D6779_07120, partial [Candidatus Parcubacteria bacterium]
GALLENIDIAARHFGYEADIAPFPDPQNPNITARITLRRGATKNGGDLYLAIFRRSTNRKPFATTPIADSVKQAFLRSANPYPDVELKLVENKATLQTLGTAGAANEVVLFSNKTLHRLFFDEIVWTEEEERERKGGLYLKTMELKPPQEKMIKLLRHWPLMRLAGLLGIPKAIAKENARTYASAGLMGAIVVPDDDKSFLHAGRVLQRIWLTATKENLGFHIITGILYMYQQLIGGKKELFSPRQQQVIRKAYHATASAFGVPKDKCIAVMFRTGKADPPSGTSSKKAPEIHYYNS